VLKSRKCKRKSVHIKRCVVLKKIEKNKSGSFIESFIRLKTDWNQLLNDEYFATDFKFLLRMAINIKQICHDAKKSKHPKTWKEEVDQLSYFLSTPVGAPFVSRVTLLQAADNFSEQEPRHSDLAQLLSDFSKFRVDPLSSEGGGGPQLSRPAELGT
jgi:hypothetical protein